MLEDVAINADEAARKRPPCPECGEIWEDVPWLRGEVRRMRFMCPHERVEQERREAQEARGRRLAEQVGNAKRSYRDAPPPAAYQSKRLVDLDDRPCSKQGRIAAQRYVETWGERKAEGQGLILAGDIGTGKTMLAALIANELVELGVFSQFLTVTDLQGRLRNFDHAEEAMRRLKQTDLLVLDDFGQERATEWSTAQLFDLIDTRYQHKRPIIFTTNLGAKGLIDHYVRCLTHGKDQMPQEQAELTVQRIISRIRQRNVTVQFRGEDQRAAAESNWLSDGAA